MNDLPFRFGAECYTWFMNDAGRTHANRLGHMIEVTARAGFAGIEPIFSWMGDLADPALLREHLTKANVELVALAFGQPWNHAQETDEERKQADAAIRLLKQFPGAMLCTVQLPTGRHDLHTRRRHLTANVNAVSRRATEAGVPCTFHPNSPHGSIIRTAEDYAAVLENLDARVTGWTPDVGHIANGGMDPIEVMTRYRQLINLVHFKDWDGNPEFCLMGKGKVDFADVTRWLCAEGFKGWVICEDEGPEALQDPDGVTMHDGRWIREDLIPSLRTLS